MWSSVGQTICRDAASTDFQLWGSRPMKSVPMCPTQQQMATVRTTQIRLTMTVMKGWTLFSILSHKRSVCKLMSSLTANRKSRRSSHKLQKQTLFRRTVCRQYFKQTLNCWRVQSVAMIWTASFHQILDGPRFKRAAAEQLVQLNNTIQSLWVLTQTQAQHL